MHLALAVPQHPGALAGEPLEEYVQPEGGGFYFALPGVTDERGFLGEGIFA
ncbi:MAG TPA: hypothetical protein VHK25_00535 [Acidimicrobiales bacterium]|jgi:deferrochelatase/peroxidase EfeB|nr:hypothetical protein [Acidimicrobiales bacterium]